MKTRRNNKEGVVRLYQWSAHLWSHLFSITSEEDYHFPGIFCTPFPQRMAYCSDIRTLPHFDPANVHFLFTDIQFGKGKARNPQKTKMSVGGKNSTGLFHVEVSSTVDNTKMDAHILHLQGRSSLHRSGDCPIEFASQQIKMTDGGGSLASDVQETIFTTILHMHPLKSPQR